MNPLDVAEFRDDLIPLDHELQPYSAALLSDPNSTLPNIPVVRRAALEYLPWQWVSAACQAGERIEATVQGVNSANIVMKDISDEELDMLITGLQDRFQDISRAARGSFAEFERLLWLYGVAWLKEKGKLAPIFKDLDESLKQLSTARLDRTIGHSAAAGAEEGTREIRETEGLTWKKTGEIAAGLEMILEPGQRALVVPADGLGSAPVLGVSPGIPELKASLMGEDVRVDRYNTAEQARALIPNRRPSLLLITPEEFMRGGWEGLGVPTVVLPAWVAAKLEARDLSALAVAAEANGGVVRINDLTQSGAEEMGSVDVLHMV